MNKIASAIINELSDSIADITALGAIGGVLDEFGQIIFDNVKVICYRVDGEYEIDIVTKNGAFGFDVPIGKITVKER